MERLTIMRYFWNMTTGDLVQTRDKHRIAVLLENGYVEVSRERFEEIAKTILERD